MQPVYSELYHHGVLGQKWGIRRYQNPDGTLTSLGKKRLRQGTERTKYQDEAWDKYKKEFNEELKKVNSGKEWTGDGSEAFDLIGEEKAAKMFNAHLDNLASAKIKDLGIKETKEAKEYVNSLLDDDRFREYSVTSLGDGETFTWYLDNRTKNDPDFKERYRGFNFVDVEERKKQINDSMKENNLIRNKLKKKKNLTESDKEILDLMDMDDEDMKRELEEFKSVKRF